jgi:hypothetical protein
MGSNAVKRIEDVRGLRGRQFNEDSGPMAHPIRPGTSEKMLLSVEVYWILTLPHRGRYRVVHFHG